VPAARVSFSEPLSLAAPYTVDGLRDADGDVDGEDGGHPSPATLPLPVTAYTAAVAAFREVCAPFAPSSPSPSAESLRRTANTGLPALASLRAEFLRQVSSLLPDVASRVGVSVAVVEAIAGMWAQERALAVATTVTGVEWRGDVPLFVAWPQAPRSPAGALAAAPLPAAGELALQARPSLSPEAGSPEAWPPSAPAGATPGDLGSAAGGMPTGPRLPVVAPPAGSGGSGDAYAAPAGALAHGTFLLKVRRAQEPMRFVVAAGDCTGDGDAAQDGESHSPLVLSWEPVNPGCKLVRAMQSSSGFAW
jgi:hypothetical protein